MLEFLFPGEYISNTTNMGFYHHHYPSYFSHGHRYFRGRLRNKVVFLGVTLWLTTTVIAGVRRATGWTHNSYRIAQEPQDKRRQGWHDMVAWQLQDTRKQAESHMRKLEQQYVDAADNEEQRQQRREWVEAEKQKMSEYWATSANWMSNRSQRPCKGGVVSWYLGVGERTFDWFERKLSRSSHFHWQDPRTPYTALNKENSMPEEQHSSGGAPPNS